MAYTAEKPTPPPSAEELRARIPGWGADLDPADRPSYPKDQAIEVGAHWTFPEEQPVPPGGRERSIEHGRLTPVFGTAQPLHGASGAIRRFAYARFSEARAAHWLLLVAADRVDAGGAHVRSLLSRHPDNPITETGILAERRWSPIGGRLGRADLRHQWMDPVIVAGPWILAVVGVVAVARRVLHRR
ncbi:MULTISPECIES: hypothetical protein [Microbacterium]|uniref:hypothetical protein n=1 Tax=Microbacterium TaxID=33882 RepID=UPI00278AAF70|nr:MULTISPECIES: hypothetical protein [Microbacterium]MDQ1084819.1 hypothetical protein [Microbacterium sp. SORGH_AS_0344]MDQ1169901.1 hypothetical protein [Microbacterium proteolyticum]